MMLPLRIPRRMAHFAMDSIPDGSWMIGVLGLAFELAGFIVLWHDTNRAVSRASKGQLAFLTSLASSLGQNVRAAERRASNLRMQSMSSSQSGAMRALGEYMDHSAALGTQSILSLQQTVAHLLKEETERQSSAQDTLHVSRWALYFVAAGASLQLLALFT